MTESQQTALYDLHLHLKAKMTNFAGYQMPLQYPDGILAEHRHCRTKAGFFDISHMGQYRLAYQHVALLGRLTPTQLSHLTDGQQRYTVLTLPNGGILDDLLIGRLGEHIFLVVNAACKAKDFAYLQNHCEQSLVELTEQALLALQGPKAKEVMLLLAPELLELKFMRMKQISLAGIDCIVSRSGYTGEDGFEISVPIEQATVLAELLLSFPDVRPIGLGARDTLRLEAGLSLYGHELSESISPVEAGLSWLIDKDKTDYPGADVIHTQLLQGAPRKRVGLFVEGKLPVREQAELLDAQGGRVGYTTSGGFAPSLNRPIAMALIEQDCQQRQLYTQIRNQPVSLQVTPIPFVMHRYYRE